MGSREAVAMVKIDLITGFLGAGKTTFLKKYAEYLLFRPILDMAGVWFRTKDDVCFHDPLAVVSIFNDSVCKFVRGNVSVELGSKSLMGYTLFEENLNGKHEIACSVNTEAFFDEYFSVFQ